MTPAIARLLTNVLRRSCSVQVAIPAALMISRNSRTRFEPTGPRQPLASTICTPSITSPEKVHSPVSWTSASRGRTLATFLPSRWDRGEGRGACAHAPPGQRADAGGPALPRQDSGAEKGLGRPRGGRRRGTERECAPLTDRPPQSDQRIPRRWRRGRRGSPKTGAPCRLRGCRCP